jgi:MFS family permease
VSGATPGAGTHEVQLSPLRWWVLAMCALAIFSSYYESDVIAPIADLLLRTHGLTQLQIGDLNAAMSLPNIPLAILNGYLVDRYGAARVALWAAAIGFVGAVMTAIGTPYSLMWAGRFVFGISEGAIFIALIAGLASWFPRSGIALATALMLSLARVGSYSADMSPTLAKPLYEGGWQPPLWLGAGICGVGLVAAFAYRIVDARRAVPAGTAPTHQPFVWRDIWSFDVSFWTILGVHVLYAAVFFPFRQTYAIEYLQHAKGLSNAVAGQVNSGVFAAAVFATPVFGLLADRIGHRALLLCIGTLLLPVTFIVLGLTDLSPWVSTILMGISWALVPAVIWPSTTLIVDPRRLGTALGVIIMLQSLGLWSSNRFAGWLADLAGAGPANPAGYGTMLWFFGLLSLTALTSAILLWRRERGPLGHGLEQAGTARRRPLPVAVAP